MEKPGQRKKGALRVVWWGWGTGGGSVVPTVSLVANLGACVGAFAAKKLVKKKKGGFRRQKNASGEKKKNSYFKVVSTARWTRRFLPDDQTSQGGEKKKKKRKEKGGWAGCRRGGLPVFLWFFVGQLGGKVKGRSGLWRGKKC